MKPSPAPFLGALLGALFLCRLASADVVITSMLRVAEARASATDVSVVNTDKDTVLDETTIGEFNAAPTAVASGDVPIEGGRSAQTPPMRGSTRGLTSPRVPPG